MRKIFYVLLVVFSLSSCVEQRITEVLFIASIGFELENEDLCAYFYLPTSDDIGNTNQSNGSGEFLKIKGGTIIDVFQKSQETTELEINLRHVSSIIISERLFNDDFLIDFIYFVKNSDFLDFNFYLFSTKDKLEEIYNFQNPNRESVLNSLLISTYDSPALFLGCDPVHFLNFARDFLVNKSIKLPFITVEKIWHTNDDFVNSYHCSESCLYYTNNLVSIVDENSSLYLKNNKEFYDGDINFKNYKINISFKEKITINVKSKYVFIRNSIKKEDVEQLIIKRIDEYITKYLKMDPFNLNYYNKILNRKHTYDQVDYKIKIELY